MSYLLGKQAGLTLDFCYCEQELPDSPLYFLPSVSGTAMNKRSYDALGQKVWQGATLYLSMHDGFLTEFEELTGLRLRTTHMAHEQGTATFAGEALPYSRSCVRRLEATAAEVLAADEQGGPLFSKVRYGQGTVYYLNFPVEKMLLEQPKGYERPYYKLYQEIAAQNLAARGVTVQNHYVGITHHMGAAGDYAVLVNYTAEKQRPGVQLGGAYRRYEALRGTPEELRPYDAAVLKLLRE